MANTITNQVLENDGIVYKHLYTVISDGATAMTDVVVVDKSTLTSKVTGIEPEALDLVEFESEGGGTFNSAVLEWDHGTDSTIIAIGPNTNTYWYPERGDLKDPKISDSTGDVVITTNGLGAGCWFQFYAVWRLRSKRA